MEQGAIAREQLFEAEQALRDRQRAITESQGELKQALAEANRLQAGLAQKQAEKRTTQLEAQQRIQQLEVEITQLKAKITETVNLMKSATTRLTQYFLRAPVSGFVSSLNVHNVGEVVQPGQTVAEMAPHKVPLVLSAVLPNREAGFVKRGMPVQVKFDAYPYQDFGIVPGKVISISSDAKPDERLGPVYKVEVALERNYITANNQTIEFKPGQTAAAEIVIRHRRIADVLLDPIKQIQKGGINL
ncbi:MAG: Hemolysin secretion protein D, chromosomal [Chroococcidiopsis sp. SAG 2025]|uniref:HlyD family efflux transporter periplasmic adaptor subunit n=1 Tax=Chroococcidiopsis sp. SAG 2025 TaxID=171389 RepID=UPI0029373D41|nr:HlyD family efflux transporter periplasmic adaptor subunit [Chroococcidiopsis sp. SAG 2025]MDV2993507.1 Hemolysin secretion protein D, chromosomal [Chroococcidiopsis sp. SAG 2025]